MQQYLKDLVEPSYIHEALFTGYLWSNPHLFQKYKIHKIKESTFTKPIWYFYYFIGKQMYDNGIREFDDKTVYSFLMTMPKEFDKKPFYDTYTEYGGYQTISEIMKECKKDKENDDYHFSEVQKYEILRTSQDEGLINVNDSKLVSKLVKLNLVQLKMYFQHKYSSLFSSVNHGEVIETDFLDEQFINDTIEDMNKGDVMGLPLHNASRLNRKIKGWRNGTLSYLVLSSGVGKTSILIEKYLLALIENGEKGMLFANEETAKKFMRLLLATVAASILKTPINREKMTEGNFEQSTRDKLNKAKEWLVKNRPDMIKFFHLKKYRVEDILARIEQYRPRGYKYAFLDTFKPDRSGSDSQRWEKFSNNAQELHDIIKEDANNVATLATVQLKIGKEYRFLDLGVIGKSTEIVEVADTVLIGRLMYSDEYPGGKNELKAYNYAKSPFDDSWVKEPYELDKNKEYLILFIAKTREGAKEEQILYEANYSINQWKEVAFVQVPRTVNSVG